MPRQVFDAHLDLAYLAELGRDMHAPLSDCRGRLLPAAVTLPSLSDGAVSACLGTIFTEAQDPDADSPESGPFAYPADDSLAAWRAGMRQLKLYHAWRDAGVIELMPLRGRSAVSDAPAAPLRLGVLVECADPIESPDQLDEWVEGGVIAIGMAWWRGSRYAGGNGRGGGLSEPGRELAARMDELGVVHDLSHLSQRATDDLLSHTDRAVIASHSNCRALLGDEKNKDWQRHISDDTIREIARRGGVMGLNLVRNFIRHPLGKTDRPSVDEAIDHVEHVCEIAGHRRAVGLGTDMDGGIRATDLPEGIDTPADLALLFERLGARGWPDHDIDAFAFGNWDRFWSGAD